MKEFIVCFYEDGEHIFYKGDGTPGSKVEFKKDDLIRVTEDEMFKWIQLAHHNQVKLSIYEATMVCDMS